MDGLNAIAFVQKQSKCPRKKGYKWQNLNHKPAKIRKHGTPG